MCVCYKEDFPEPDQYKGLGQNQRHVAGLFIQSRNHVGRSACVLLPGVVPAEVWAVSPPPTSCGRTEAGHGCPNYRSDYTHTSSRSLERCRILTFIVEDICV